MKKLFTLILTVFACVATYADTEVTFDFSAQGYTNGLAMDAVAIDANVTATFDKGTNSNGPKYYTTGTAVRLYGGNSMTLTTTSGNIKSIELTFSSGDGTNAITADCGNFSENAWSGEETSVKLTIGGTSGHRRIKTITVTYGKDEGNDPVAVESVSLTDGNGNALSTYTMLTVTDELQVKAVVNPSNATNKKVTWEVMQQSEVISFENGVVKALAPGQAALVATTEDGEKQAATTFYVSAITDGTIADFIAAGGKTCYLTGVVSNIVNTTYGNFDLTDESGTIYVYGCLNADGESKKFAELGVSEGDKIKVLAREYKLYGETKEAVNVVFVENLGPVVEKEYTFEVVAGDTEFTVTPSDNEVLYYIELLPSEYDKETVTNYFDGIFEEMGSGLEYFSGKQTQSYEEWYCDEGEEGNICICAVSNDYKRISEVSLIPFKYDTTTGITIVNNAVKNAVIFNLNGQRINANVKGIVIKNGKKFVQK